MKSRYYIQSPVMHNNLSCPSGNAASKKEEAFRFDCLSWKGLKSILVLTKKCPTDNTGDQITSFVRGKQLPASL